MVAKQNGEFPVSNLTMMVRQYLLVPITYLLVVLIN